jgi:stress-induced morphogen
MSAKTPKQTDLNLQAVRSALARYKSAHPRAETKAYRQNSVSLRVRIVDPDFAGVDKSERHNSVWRYLDELPEDTQSQISVLLLLTPVEQKSSFANVEFDAPVPSAL